MYMSRQISCSVEAMVNKPCLCHTNTEYRRRACRERRVTNLTHEQGPCRNTASSLTPESPQQAFRTLSKKLGKLSCIINLITTLHLIQRCKVACLLSKPDEGYETHTYFQWYHKLSLGPLQMEEVPWSTIFLFSGAHLPYFGSMVDLFLLLCVLRAFLKFLWNF